MQLETHDAGRDTPLPTIVVCHRGQIDILKFDKSTGKAPSYDRPLKLEIWYPAVIPPGKEEKTSYVSAMFGTQNAGGTFEIAGTIHDIRRTVATGMADIGIAPHIVEAVLNHVSGARAGAGQRNPKGIAS
jgi:integrase